MRLLVRADATPETGAGHVMRCATLAEAWMRQQHGEAVLWGDVTLPFVQKRLSGSGIGTAAASHAGEAAVLLVDNYVSTIRRDAIAQVESRVSVLVDDLGEPEPGYDVIWNPNAYESEHLYRGFHGTLVTKQVPLRSALPKWEARSPSVGVVLGGGTVSPAVVTAIDEWRLRCGVSVVTPSRASTPAGWSSVAADTMWSALSNCSCLITAAGSTVWEAAAIGIPCCIVVTAANQRLVAQWAASHGAPVIDATSPRELSGLSSAIEAGVAGARALPTVTDGSDTVARLIARLAAER